jgi:hypothetical protein
MTLVAFLCLFAQVCAFAPPRHASLVRQPLRSGVAFARPSKSSSSSDDDDQQQQGLVDVLSEQRGVWAPTVAGLVSGLGGFVAQGMATDELVIEELPPPYVPALFGVLLLVGVGALTASLGNVMDEGKLLNNSMMMMMMTRKVSKLSRLLYLTLRSGELTLFFVNTFMTTESQLGMQSGARAKKEIERSRSSYFKKN